MVKKWHSFRSEAIIPALIAALKQTRGASERSPDLASIIEVLARFGPKAKAAIPELRKRLDDDVDSVAEAAAKALVRIGGD